MRLAINKEKESRAGLNEIAMEGIRVFLVGGK